MVPEDEFRADQYIAEQYITFSAELLRLALVCIGAVGFLLSGNVLKTDQFFKEPARSQMTWAMILLLLAACFALLHRYLASQSMAYQLSTLRARKMMELQTDPKAVDKWTRDHTTEKSAWHGSLKWSGYAILSSSICLGLGMLLLVLGLVSVFTNGPN